MKRITGGSALGAIAALLITGDLSIPEQRALRYIPGETDEQKRTRHKKEQARQERLETIVAEAKNRAEARREKRRQKRLRQSL